MVKVGKMKKKRKICIYRRIEGLLTALARPLALYYGHAYCQPSCAGC